jgi:cbb3-type cytochrome oxidase subunit 3
MMDNVLVALFMGLPFMVFIGLKYVSYRRQKKYESAEEINSILLKHGKEKVFKNDDQDKKAA